MLQAAEEVCCCDTTMWLPWDSLTRDHRNVLILPISLSFGRNFFFSFFFWFRSLFVCFSHSLSIRSWHVQASPFLSSPFSGACSLGGREETSALCTQTWQSVTDTQANANNGSNACGKMRKCGGGSEAPPLPTYTWDFTYDYIHKTLLPWQQVFSYLGTRPFQCRNSSLKSLPALPCF